VVRVGAREHLTGYKVPRQVFVVEALPRSMVGKVVHREVRDQILASRANPANLEHPDRRS